MTGHSELSNSIQRNLSIWSSTSSFGLMVMDLLLLFSKETVKQLLGMKIQSIYVTLRAGARVRLPIERIYTHFYMKPFIRNRRGHI